MGADTSIQWADSSLNLQMGCDGCELWSRAKKTCYAGIQTRGRAGFKGWPKSFEEPELFLDRLAPALKWRDLTGTEREDKPWLNGMPRLIFLNDMGDTFSSKLPLYWMAPLLPLMAASPHQFLLLTKRPSRAVEFSEKHPFPPNFWIGTSVTSAKTIPRIEQLLRVQGGSKRFVSFEPMFSLMPDEAYRGLDWAIFGGESGDAAEETCMNWLLSAVHGCARLEVPCFVKQLGAKAYFHHYLHGGASYQRVPFHTKDSHGGDWSEWPMELRVRQMPSVKTSPVQTTLI